MAGKFAFVVPRYGRDIAGGAETLVAELARKLAATGDTIDVLTTCARDNRTWNNELPPGITVEDGVTVYRFAVDERNLDNWIPLQISLSQGIKLSLEQQLQWMTDSVNSSGLYEYISRHGEAYDALFFAPYLFGTTFWGSLIHPQKSILIPCLHDENYAYQDVIASMFKQTKGCLFNAKAEMKLARNLYGDVKGGVVGMGFHPVDETEELSSYFKDSFPYVLYIGRKETGKNVHLLVDYFVEAKNKEDIPRDLRLVIAGGGSFADLGRNSALEREDIIDVEHVSELDKRRLIKNSLCVCQPSVNESFSIVLMEAWQLHVPVLVHARCKVTKEHCIESNGGLYFSNVQEFSKVVELLCADKKLYRDLATNGARYVADQYSWPAIIGRFHECLSSFESNELL